MEKQQKHLKKSSFSTLKHPSALPDTKSHVGPGPGNLVETTRAWSMALKTSNPNHTSIVPGHGLGRTIVMQKTDSKREAADCRGKRESRAQRGRGGAALNSSVQ